MLIVTAIRSDTTRVMDYINRLDNYDGLKLAGVAKEAEHGLFEEALQIYKKFNEPVEAIKVLLYNLENLKSASEFAEKANNPDVWSELGKAQLDLSNLNASVDAFIKAQDACMYQRVILLAQAQSEYGDLINYLLMARKAIKDQLIDNELIFSYAKGGEASLGELESFVNEPNQADIQKCGDRCFDDKLYLAAEILYKRIQNNQKLATTYVMLKKY